MIRRFRVESRIVKDDRNPIINTPTPQTIKETADIVVDSATDLAKVVGAIYLGKKVVDTSADLILIVVKTKLK